MINEKTRKEVYYRDLEKCVICGTKYNLERTPHHAFFKSSYFGDDRNEAWNLCTICRDCHRVITHATNNEEVIKGKKAAKKCREIALGRYEGQHETILIKKIRERHGNNWKKIKIQNYE